MKQMEMITNAAWCVLLYAACCFAQDEIKVSIVGSSDSVIFQDVDKRLTENGRNNSDILDIKLLNINKAVISNEYTLSISNTQIIKPEIIENSSSLLSYNNSANSTEVVTPELQSVNNSFVIAEPLDIRTDLNSTDYSYNEGNGTMEDGSIQTIKSLIETNDSTFQVESSSQNNEKVQATPGVGQSVEVVTDNPSSKGNDKQITTTSTRNDDKEDKIDWSEEVTQYNDDYKTTIIFTNLYSPGEDEAMDPAEEPEVETTAEKREIKEAISHETEGSLVIPRELTPDTKDDIKNDETATLSTIMSIINGHINSKEDTLRSTDGRKLIPVLINGHIGSPRADEGNLYDKGFNDIIKKDDVEIAKNAKQPIEISTKVVFPSILVANQENTYSSPLPNVNDSSIIVTEDSLVLNIEQPSDNMTSQNENETGDINAIKSEINRSRWTGSTTTLPTVPLRIPPQNRKDIKALIEEKRRMSSQNTFRRVPSFRINATRSNREPVRISTRNPFDKLSLTVKNQSLEREPDGRSEVEPDIYEMEQSARQSWGGCARECGATSMTCRYELTLEWFHTMSKACYSCPRNISDCFRPHCIPADGVKRTIAVINRSLPGPLIQVCEGDTIVAKVTNQMMESTTTIHWHGQHQLLSPYMDGVPSVTQCPIQPGASFTYSFKATQPGTHFYHSHSGVQRGDGAFGGLIIRRAQSKERHRWTYDQDLPEHTITILDWTHRLGLQTFTHHHHAGGPNKPDAILVNGRGIVGDRSLPPASFTVTKGMRYRFRLINAGVLNCPIRISIDDHRLTIIATDGNDIQPYIVDWLVTYAGERWDFVLEAKADISNYWMRFIGLMDCDQRFTSAHQGAVLHYSGAPTLLPSAALAYDSTTSSPRLERPPKVLNALNAGISDGTTLIHQLSGLARAQPWLATREPDKKLVFAYDFNPLDNELFHKPSMYGFSQVLDVSSKVYTPQLNHISLKLPPFPLLTQSNMMTDDMLCSNMNQETCKQTYCECTNIIDIPLGNVVEVILIDQGFVYDANHPFHLHGHSFYVVGMDRLGNNVTSEKVLELDEMGLIRRNLGDPPLKDTVTVPDGGYTIIRFLANNPGYWLLHCHIDFHVEVGMAVVLRIGDSRDLPPPPPGFPTCGDFDPTRVNLTAESKVTEPQDNSLEQGEVSLLDSIVNPSFGSRWKYNMSSPAYASYSSRLYTTLCFIILMLLSS